MFDINFSEIVLIAVVALIVLGPERLPKAARTVGALLRRARTSWQGVKSEIERELAAEDLKRSLAESRRAADIGDDLRSLKADLTSPTAMKPSPAVPPASAPPTSPAERTPSSAAAVPEKPAPAATPAADPGMPRHDRD